MNSARQRSRFGQRVEGQEHRDGDDAEALRAHGAVTTDHTVAPANGTVA